MMYFYLFMYAFYMKGVTYDGDPAHFFEYGQNSFLGHLYVSFEVLLEFGLGSC